MLNDWRKLEIEECEWTEDPRDYDETTKLCIREHRRYDFPNELDYSFEIVDEWYEWYDDPYYKNRYDEEIAKLEWYYIFPLDCYEHSGISFSLSGTGMQCQFDTSKNCWFIAVPKKDKLPNENIWSERSEEEARNIAKQAINTYNRYLNNECYKRTTYTPEKWTNEKWESKIEWAFEDSCTEYEDVDWILDEFSDFISE